MSTPAEPWWRHAVIYQVYPRSFADTDGNGIGDLPGVRSRLPYLRRLGVDAIWLSPFYPSPQADAGYDVADYRDVDPLFGTLADFDGVVHDAHALGIRVIVDIVPNHTSSDHEWFQAALAAGPGSRERARFLFREGRGSDGAEPPNDWQSTFGGPAWTRVTEADGSPGQWYLHLFDTRQPDLDWTNPEVVEEFHSILRFWLDRDVDGFRIDVAHGLAKDPGMPDVAGRFAAGGAARTGHPHWDQDAVHEVYRGWREVIDAYDGDRAFVGEIWLHSTDRVARYLRPGELHTAFNFHFLLATWDPDSLRHAIDASIASMRDVGAPATWVLSNHDVVRHVSRYGGADLVLGTRRARAGTLLMLALPGQRLRVPGRGARARSRARHPRRAARGPDVPAHQGCRGGARRLPGAAAVVRRRAAVRLRTRPEHVVAAAGGVEGADGRSPGGRPRVDAVDVPGRPGRAPPQRRARRRHAHLAGHAAARPRLPARAGIHLRRQRLRGPGGDPRWDHGSAAGGQRPGRDRQRAPRRHHHLAGRLTVPHRRIGPIGPSAQCRTRETCHSGRAVRP